MNHLEGGWPKNVDISDPQSKRIHIKSLLQEKSYKTAIQRLSEPTERFIKQNVALDIYEEYFVPKDVANGSGASVPEDLPYEDEKIEAKMVSVFKDPSKVKRTACHLSWLPGDGSKLAVAFCDMNFSKTSVMEQNVDANFESYIWDINNPNRPEVTLVPQSPLCCLEFNPKDTNLLVGGCYNGVVNLFDVRSPDKSPIEESDIKLSHRDPIYDVRWIQSKNSTMFLTVSTDGLVNLWDTRQLAQPSETLTLELQEKNGIPPPINGTLGGFSLHYNAAHSAAKYMVGTEQGAIVACTRRKNKPTLIDRSYLAHHGPVYSVMRNPFLPKYFLSIGDWTAKVWEEETESPIISTKYHDCYLTSGCWSTSRPGVFFTTKADGSLDIWDLYHQQSYPSLTVSVSQQALHTIRLLNGQNLAVGGVDGSVTMIQLSDALSGFKHGERVTNNDELEAMRSMFERESKRENRILFKRKQMQHEKHTSGKEKGERPAHVEIEQFDAEFEDQIKEEASRGPSQEPDLPEQQGAEEETGQLEEEVANEKDSEEEDHEEAPSPNAAQDENIGEMNEDVDSEQVNGVEEPTADSTTQGDETNPADTTQLNDSGNRIQNTASQLFIEIDFAGAPEEMPKDGSVRLVVQPAKDSWTQRFRMENGFITNVVTGLRLTHGAQEQAFAVMLPAADNDNTQVWNIQGEGCLISAHDQLGLTTAANDAGSQVDIRPFDVNEPPKDCTWSVVSEASDDKVEEEGEQEQPTTEA